MSDFSYIKTTYEVPACIGRVVTVYGKPGVITADHGNYIGVTFDTDKPGTVRNCHPTDGVEYSEKVVKPRRQSCSARRYQEYLHSDCGHSFSEWLGIRPGKHSV